MIFNAMLLLSSSTFLVHVWSTDCLNLCLHVGCKTKKIIYLRSHWNSSLKASMQQKHTPCAHYLSITDQLLWSHSSRLQIRPVQVALSSTISSTISLWDAQPWAISPSGQSVRFTPQQVIVVDSARQLLLWGKNSFWNPGWNSAVPATRMETIW